MYFCQDVDLMIWEPGIFLEPAFGHQALFADVAGTLTGTGLVMGSSVLGHALPGMVARIELADDSLTQLLEVVSVTDGTHAVVSALRGRAGESAVTPLVGGSVKVGIVTFRPQIAAVGDELLGILGVMSGTKYLYVLCGEVIVAAFYLFETYWIAMRNMMYANR